MKVNKDDLFTGDYEYNFFFITKDFAYIFTYDDIIDYRFEEEISGGYGHLILCFDGGFEHKIICENESESIIKIRTIKINKLRK